MKKLTLLIFLLFSMLYANVDINTTANHQAENTQSASIAYTSKESNITRHIDTSHLGDLGGFLEPILAANTQNIAHLIMMFAAFIGLISFYAFFNLNQIEKKIEKNRNIIQNLEDKLEKDIEREVKAQIIYSASDVLQDVEDDAYKKIDHEVKQIRSRAQNKLFDYQEFIFQVNQAKKYEYEEVINDPKILIEDKLKKITIIQGRYNEINNNDIPKLFSDNIKDILIPAAKKLSGESELSDIIINHLVHSIKENGYSDADSLRIKNMLKKDYNYDLER